MLNIFDTARQAASEFGLSMKDDPTIWPAGSEITPEIVRKTCNAAALENARSALSRALGKIAETVATEMDVEIADNGPLADLDAVLALHVEDGPDFDLSAVAAAPDWQARVEAVREAFGIAVHGYCIAPLSVADLLRYANSDERLNGDIRRGIAALHDEPVNSGDEWDEPDAVDQWAEEAPKRERGKPSPGKTRRTKAEIAEDNEPTSEAPAPAMDAGWDDAEPTATAQNLPGLAGAAGIADGEMATILGMSKGYYSQVRNGKRPWPGLKPDQVKRLRAELAGRREAIAAVEAALTADTVLKPEGA